MLCSLSLDAVAKSRSKTAERRFASFILKVNCDRNGRRKDTPPSHMKEINLVPSTILVQKILYLLYIFKLTLYAFIII